MVRAAFFDIDGTLYSHRTHTIPQSALDALTQLKSNGIRIFLATGRGRTAMESLPDMDLIPRDGAITLNGAYCYDHSGPIHHDPVSPEDIGVLLEHLQAHPIPCAFVEADQTYINYYDDHVYAVHNAIHAPLPPMGDLERGRLNPVYQILLYLKSSNRNLLPPMPHSRFAGWHTGGLDCFSATAGKGAGIQKVLAHYGIAKEEAIAFGDAENDLDMFDAVHTAIAMGNAAPEIRAAADYVTEDIDDDGIFRALVHLGLI